MAKVTFMALGAYALQLARYASQVRGGKMLEHAVHDGAEIVADKIRENLQALPEESFRALREGERFNGLPPSQKDDLLRGFGLTPISADKSGFLHTKAGFDGYGQHPTKKYPQGVPNQLLARAVESGSSVRNKTPFVRTAVAATSKAAVQAMQRTIDEETAEIFGGK